MQKSYRDPLAYFVRIAMYLGLAILMATAWLHLSYDQRNIQNILNALFFGSGFMSFMVYAPFDCAKREAVAYIPAFLEDRAALAKERANGLYGPTAFLVANFLIGLPFLCTSLLLRSVNWIVLICLLFSLVTYFSMNLRHGAIPFWTYLAVLYLDLIAAEALVVLISSVFPIFVVALAATAFANGLLMTVSGYLIDSSVLNVFWKYTFYQIGYHRYAIMGRGVGEKSDDRECLQSFMLMNE